MRKTEMSVQEFKNQGGQPIHSFGLRTYHYEGFRDGEGCCERTYTPSVVNGWCCILPLRFSGLPIKRKLTRMMLLLEQAQFHPEQHSDAETSLPLVTDYVRSLMNTAVSRGELRFRSPDEMVRYYLSLAGELKGHFTTRPHTRVCLRSQVRRRIRIFIEKYAAGGWV